METTFLKDNTGKRYIAFFDLDRTIIKEISGSALARRAFREGLMSWSSFANAIYLYVLYKLRLRDPLKVIDDMVGWVKGMPEALMVELSSKVVREVLYPSVFTEAITEINIHKTKDAKITILSSGLNTVCSEMSEKLGLDDMICSSLEVKNGYLTGKPAGRLCFGEEKLYRLTGYCKLHNINEADSWYYGDSISDLPVLMAVGNPVCVNPDRKLKKEALNRGWKIVHWTH
jgi:HAD superfamily hydrolase (TIGR01490 family)